MRPGRKRKRPSHDVALFDQRANGHDSVHCASMTPLQINESRTKFPVRATCSPDRSASKVQAAQEQVLVYDCTKILEAAVAIGIESHQDLTPVECHFSSNQGDQVESPRTLFCGKSSSDLGVQKVTRPQRLPQEASNSPVMRKKVWGSLGFRIHRLLYMVNKRTPPSDHFGDLSIYGPLPG